MNRGLGLIQTIFLSLSIFNVILKKTMSGDTENPTGDYGTEEIGIFGNYATWKCNKSINIPELLKILFCIFW